MKKQNKMLLILPDMASFIREVTAYGNMGAMARRVLRLGLQNIFTLAWWNKTNVMSIAKKDFAAGMVMLMQTSLLALTQAKGSYIGIADQVVDLAVAMKNKKMLIGLIEAVKKAGYKPVLMTNNLPSLIRFLSQTKVRNVWFIFPDNKDGYEMNPSREEVIKYKNMLEPHWILNNEFSN